MSRSSKKAIQVSQKSIELAVTAPQVIAQRLARMAMAGPDPSGRDKKEFVDMVEEKQQAFAESWMNMSLHAMQSNHAMGLSLLEAMVWPKGGSYFKASQQLTQQLHDSQVEMLNKGLAPVHKKVLSNAKRLAKG